MLVLLFLMVASCSYLNDPAPVIPENDGGPLACAAAYQNPTKNLPQISSASYVLYEAVHDCVCPLISQCVLSEAVLQAECDADSVGQAAVAECTELSVSCSQQITNCINDK